MSNRTFLKTDFENSLTGQPTLTIAAEARLCFRGREIRSAALPAGSGDRGQRGKLGGGCRDPASRPPRPRSVWPRSLSAECPHAGALQAPQRPLCGSPGKSALQRRSANCTLPAPQAGRAGSVSRGAFSPGTCVINYLVGFVIVVVWF